MTDAERERYSAAGHRPYWRFLLEDGDVAWTDLARGEVRFEGRHLSDPVLFRADARPPYTLCSVIDDIEFGIPHVLRGETHVANTAVQIQLATATGPTPDSLTSPLPPLHTDASGAPLS